MLIRCLKDVLAETERFLSSTTRAPHSMQELIAQFFIFGVRDVSFDETRHHGQVNGACHRISAHQDAMTADGRIGQFIIIVLGRAKCFESLDVVLMTCCMPTDPPDA